MREDQLDWSGEWPRLFPNKFGHWLTERALIYFAVAGITVIFFFLLVAAQRAGLSLGFVIPVLFVVAGLAYQKFQEARHGGIIVRGPEGDVIGIMIVKQPEGDASVWQIIRERWRA